MSGKNIAVRAILTLLVGKTLITMAAVKVINDMDGPATANE